MEDLAQYSGALLHGRGRLLVRSVIGQVFGPLLEGAFVRLRASKATINALNHRWVPTRWSVFSPRKKHGNDVVGAKAFFGKFVVGSQTNCVVLIYAPWVEVDDAGLLVCQALHKHIILKPDNEL